MGHNPSPDTIHQELKALEKFLCEAPEQEKAQAASHILERVKLNLKNLRTLEEKKLALRFMTILHKIRHHLVASSVGNVAPYDWARKIWGYGLLDNIVTAPVQWSEYAKTGYSDIDFADIELYDEIILYDVEESLLKKTESVNYDQSKISHQYRAFLNGILRKARPGVIVEIGTGAGEKSCVMLNAIRDVENAKLYSFDYNTTWQGEEGSDKRRNTGFLVEQVVPDLLAKWVLKTGAMPCAYFDKVPPEGIDICVIDSAYGNPDAHLSILQILPLMKKDGIVIYCDTTSHLSGEDAKTAAHIFINTLEGKRILLKTDYTTGLPATSAIILGPHSDDMFFALFSNISLPWHFKITHDDFMKLHTHFSRYYRKDLVNIFAYYSYFYMNGGYKNKKIATAIAENIFLTERIAKADIIHFHINDKFANPTINFINKHFDQKEHLHLVHRTFPDAYSCQSFPSGENVVELLYDMLQPNALKKKKLIFHSLFSQHNIRLLYRHQELLAHAYWMVWGGDLYDAPRDESNSFVRNNIYGIGTFCDKELVMQKYGSNHKFFTTNMVITPIRNEIIPAALKRSSGDDAVVIQVNNSADPSTLKMFDILAKFKDENIRIKTVLSYGKTRCSQKIIAKGIEIFGDRFSYLERMLPPEKYMEYLLENDIFILYQNRQQGGGNACNSVVAGKKVFIKSEISTSKWMRDIGVTIFDSNKIAAMDFKQFIYFDPAIAAKNRELMEEKNYNDALMASREFAPVFADDCFAHTELEAKSCQ